LSPGLHETCGITHIAHRSIGRRSRPAKAAERRIEALNRQVAERTERLGEVQKALEEPEEQNEEDPSGAAEP
jgi:hypothetical protein